MCNAPSTVDATRGERRTRRCLNEHRFRTHEVHVPAKIAITKPLVLTPAIINQLQEEQHDHTDH